MSFDPVSFAMGKAAGGGGSGGGTDVSDTTAVASDVLAGKYFHTADGTKTAGTIAGQAAQTITPGQADQTIAAGKYLAGAQTVKGDANLVAENIKSGVSIFGVSGALALPTLNAPSLSLSGDTLSITNPATNGNFAAGYKVYAGNTLIATVQTATVDLSALLTDAGTYSVTAKAYGTGFNDSAAGTAVSYTVSAGYALTWDIGINNYELSGNTLYFKKDTPPANADDYDYMLNGDEGGISETGTRPTSATVIYVWGYAYQCTFNGYGYLSNWTEYNNAVMVTLSGDTTITARLDCYDPYA